MFNKQLFVKHFLKIYFNSIIVSYTKCRAQAFWKKLLAILCSFLQFKWFVQDFSNFVILFVYLCICLSKLLQYFMMFLLFLFHISYFSSTSYIMIDAIICSLQFQLRVIVFAFFATLCLNFSCKCMLWFQHGHAVVHSSVSALAPHEHSQLNLPFGASAKGKLAVPAHRQTHTFRHFSYRR